MAFPFKRTVEHRVYPNTFLRRVLAYVSFGPKHFEFYDDMIMESFRKFLSSMYNHEEVGDFPNKPLEIKSEEGDTEITFFNSGVLLSFNQHGYSCFIDTVVPHLTRLRLFLEKVIQTEVCEEIRLRKLNIWRFDPKEGVEMNYEVTSRAIFSSDLLAYPQVVKLGENEKTLPLKAKMEWKDGTHTLNLLTGFAKLSDGAGNLILDSEMIEYAKTPPSAMTDTMLHLNDTLFDVYQWSINDNVRNLMDFKLK